MSAREAILNRVRASLHIAPGDTEREAIANRRLDRPPRGIVPARGALGDKERVALFCQMAENVSSTVRRVRGAEDVPRAVAEYLRSKNLPASVRMGADRRLKRMPWAAQKAMKVKYGRADPDDEVGVSHAVAGVAETGTLMLHSGGDNPTTINFLPEHHIVVVEAKDVAGDLETVMARLRRKFGKRNMPRTVNFITGPSRSGDIEQKLLLGAHGPRALHVIVVG